MLPSQTYLACLLLVLLAGTWVWSAEAARGIPKPLPDHPGNIFLAGEEVSVTLPPGEGDAWRAIDYENQVVGEG